MDPGDTLLLYTDGVSEARAPSEAEYGAERLARALEQGRDLAPGALVSACAGDVQAFRGGASRSDDLTLLAIRRSPAAR